MQTIASNDRCVCQYVCCSKMHRMTSAPHNDADETQLHCVGSFGAVFAEPLWPLAYLAMQFWLSVAVQSTAWKDVCVCRV